MRVKKRKQRLQAHVAVAPRNSFMVINLVLNDFLNLILLLNRFTI